MNNHQDPFEEMTRWDKAGCLLILLSLAALWPAVMFGAFKIGQHHPHKVATDLQPCVVQSGFVSIQP